MKWFKHDADANADAKLQNVLLDYGLEGYGLYWYCIELIAGKVDVSNLTFQLEHDARIIARNTGSSPQKVEEMMKYFIKIGLFECSEGIITCLKMAKRLDLSMTSNPKMRGLISQMREKNHDGIMINHDSVMQDKNRTEEKRKDNTTPLIPQGGKVKSKKFDPLDIELPNWLLTSVWQEWVEYRSKSGKPIKTMITVTKTLKLLSECVSAGFEPKDIIDNSIANGYQGLFKPRGMQQQQTSDGPHWNSREGWSDFI